MSRGAPDALRSALGLLSRLFQGEELTVKQAAEGYPFKPPAVRRHLEALAAVVPGVKREGRPEKWRFLPGGTPGNSSLGWALAAARELLVAFRDSGIGVHLSELISGHRLTGGGLPPTGDLSRMLFSLNRTGFGTAVEASVLDKAVEAVIRSEEVGFSYVHFEGHEDEVELEPYSVILHQPSIYLYGRCVVSSRVSHLDQARLYNLGRVRAIRRTGRRFSYPHREEYDPAKLFEHCFGAFLPPEGAEPETVELSFPATWSSFLTRHPVHPSQAGPFETGDGSVRVRLRVFLTFDLVRWIRGHGQEVSVVAPPRLSRWVASGSGAKWDDGL